MAHGHNQYLRRIGLTLLVWSLPLLRAQDDPAPVAPVLAEPPAVTSIRTWQKSLREELGDQTVDGTVRPEATKPAAVPDTLAGVRSLLETVARQLATWQETMATIAQWEAEWVPAASRAEDLIARAHAYAVERRNRRALVDALTQLPPLLAKSPALHRQRQVDKLTRLGPICDLLIAPATRESALTELKSWQELLRQEALPVPLAEDMAATLTLEDRSAPPAAATLFTSVSRQVAELLQTVPPSAPDNPADPGPAVGQAEALAREADAYVAEKRERLLLQESMRQLTVQIAAWIEAEQREASTDYERLSRILDQAIAQPKVDATTDANGVSLALYGDPEDFEYYELRQVQTLRQTSAMPAVYGDPDEWPRLLQANRATAASPDAPLKIGTLLIIPRKNVVQP